MTIPSSLRNKLSKAAEEYYEVYKTDKESKLFYELGFDSFGMDCIGNGVGRNVFDMEIIGHPNLAVKMAIPHSKYDGKDQNKQEYELWNSIPESKREYLVPVKDIGKNNYWLIMKLGNTPTQSIYSWKNEAEYQLQEYVWEEDIKKENIVELNGELKLCDYGVKKA